MNPTITDEEALNRAIEASLQDLKHRKDKKKGPKIIFDDTPHPNEEEKVRDPIPQITERLIDPLPPLGTHVAPKSEIKIENTVVHRQQKEREIDDAFSKPPAPPTQPPMPGMTLHTIIKNGWVTKEWR